LVLRRQTSFVSLAASSPTSNVHPYKLNTWFLNMHS
jgi:hypothetical protein